MAEVGDFTADGAHIFEPARDENGAVIPNKTRRVKTNSLQFEIFETRRNGYVTFPEQQTLKEHPALPFRIQSNLGVAEFDLGIVDQFMDQTIIQPIFVDFLTTSAMSGVFEQGPSQFDSEGTLVSRGYTTGAVNEFVFFMSRQAFDSGGLPMQGERESWPWLSYILSLGGSFDDLSSIMFRPTVDSFFWAATPEKTTTTADVSTPQFTVIDTASGFAIRGGNKRVRWVQWDLVAGNYVVRVGYFPGWSEQALRHGIGPAVLDGAKTPVFQLSASGEFGGFVFEPEMTGAYLISQLCHASGPVRDRPADDLAATVRTVQNDVRLHRLVTQAAEDSLRLTIGQLNSVDSFLQRWISELVDWPADSIYSSLADVPETVGVFVVRSATGADLYLRPSTVHSATSGAPMLLKDFAGGTAYANKAYALAVDFVSKAKAAAGTPVSSAELDSIRSDIDKAEADILNLAKTAGREVAEVASYVIPEPIWPTGLVSSSDGSLMVRRGQVQTVKATMVNNNSFSGSSVIAQTFTPAERGKSVIARAAVKAASTTARIELAAQTFPDGGALGQATLAYVDGAWAATGGTVTLDNGWAVLDFPVKFSANANTMIAGGISPGDVQLLAIYDAGSAGYSKTVTDIELTDLNTLVKARVPLNLAAKLSEHDTKIAAVDPRISSLEGKFNSLTTVTALGGMTRSNGLPFITAPDRAGARADVLAFTFRDNRVSTSGKMAYPARVTAVTIPISAVVSNTPPAGWTAVTRTINDETLNAFYRRFNLKDSANGAANNYDCWVSWKRQNDGLDFWFESLHSFSPNLGEARDISITYVADTSVVDPKLKPIVDRVTALEAKPAPDVSGLATTDQLSAEITRAKKAEGDNALAIATNSASIKVVSDSLTAEVARAKAAEAALSTPDLTAYAKKRDLAKKQGRTKLWSPAVTDFAVTLGGIIEDTAPGFPASADIDAKIFTVAPAAPGVRAAKVSFTVTGLVVGQKYELAIEVGSGLNTGFALAGVAATTQDVTNWKKYSQIITATGPTYAGSYTVTHGAVVHGPAVYTLPGLYVQDEALAVYQVAEPADVAAAEARANGVTNLLAQTVQGQGSRISALEARPSGTSPPDSKWFPAERDYDKTYSCRTASGVQATSISFDFVAAGTTGVPMSVNLPAAGAPISGWPISQFWGIPTLFINITPPGGSAMIVTVGASTDGYVEIGVGAATGASSASIGRVRNVIIDGNPANLRT